MKPRLFIGSSAEALATLEQVQAALEPVADCRRWTKIFDQNKSGLESLLKEARLSDFGVLIATQDDVSTSRGKRQLAPRDNVIFEFGLFLGAVSPNRVFLLVEEGGPEKTKLPSDLNGITTMPYTHQPGRHNSLPKVCEEIEARIKALSAQSELGFLPSTALAFGYYNNFVKHVCKYLHEDGRVYLQEETQPLTIGSFKLNILLPADLSSNGVDDFIGRYNRQNKLRPASTELAGSSKRGYPFHFRIDPPDQAVDSKLEVQLFDVPTTLSTIVGAINLSLNSTSIGPSDDREYLKARELQNFANVLQTLVNEDVNAKDNVEVLLNIRL